MLERYYNALAAMVIRLGSNPQKLFTFDDLQCEMKRLGLFGYIISPIMQELNFADASTIIDFDVYSENYEDKVAFIDAFDGEPQRLYAERIKGIISDLVELGYCWK